ncbi:MAG: hypothetical protein D6733_04145 [Methanobacteriota archaeon]|nr:MAG: hypothetical protein D6733_04145 [Euryarchaeota archaeon]
MFVEVNYETTPPASGGCFKDHSLELMMCLWARGFVETATGDGKPLLADRGYDSDRLRRKCRLTCPRLKDRCC